MNSIYKRADAASVATSGTYASTFDMTNHKSVSFQISKTGSGKGTIKLQQSNDGTTFFDVNTTVYPGATATVAAGASSSFLWAEVQGSIVKALFTEDGTNTVAVVSGKWVGKTT